MNNEQEIQPSTIPSNIIREQVLNQTIDNNRRNRQMLENIDARVCLCGARLSRSQRPCHRRCACGMILSYNSIPCHA
jgi:hypothetical protein